jgi:uncharacterized protein
MNYHTIINKHIKDPKLKHIYLTHVSLVTKKALAIAKRVPELNPDLKLIEESAMLHDIGIVETNAPGICCYGKHKYIAHMDLGRAILEKEGLPKHALVAYRHTGVGISKDEIIKRKLALTEEDHIPITVEEEIVAFADKFYSKDPKNLTEEFTVAEIVEDMNQFGKEQGEKFLFWCKKFKEPMNG